MAWIYIKRILPDILKLGFKVFDLYALILLCIKYFSEGELSYFAMTLTFPLLAGLVASFQVLRSHKKYLSIPTSILLCIPGVNHFAFIVYNIIRSLSGRRLGLNALRTTFDLTEMALDFAPQALLQGFFIAIKLGIGKSTYFREWEELMKFSASFLGLAWSVSSVWFRGLPFAFLGLSLPLLTTRFLLFFEASTHFALKLIVIIWTALFIRPLFSTDGDLPSLTMSLLLHSIPPVLIKFFQIYLVSRRLQFTGNAFTKSQRVTFYSGHLQKALLTPIFYQINPWDKSTYLLCRVVELLLICGMSIFNGYHFSYTLPHYNLEPLINSFLFMQLVVSFTRVLLIKCALPWKPPASTPRRIIKYCKEIMSNAREVVPVKTGALALEGLDNYLKEMARKGHLRETQASGIWFTVQRMTDFTENCIRSICRVSNQLEVGYRFKMTDEEIQLTTLEPRNSAFLPMRISRKGKMLVFHELTVNQLLKVTYLSIILYYSRLRYIDGYRRRFKSVLNQIASVSLDLNPGKGGYGDNAILNYANFEMEDIVGLDKLVDTGFTRNIAEIFEFEFI